MFQEINNHCLFACAALDDHYHSQHRLKEAAMTDTRIARPGSPRK